MSIRIIGPEVVRLKSSLHVATARNPSAYNVETRYVPNLRYNARMI
jgi:hypothetical protein